MAYLMPCPCGSSMGVFGPFACCIPCGKPACCSRFKRCPPERPQESDMLRRERLFPITDSLETDRKMAIRKRMENIGEIKKIGSLANFNTDVEMEERKQDLERKADKLKRLMEEEMFMYTEEMKTAFEKQQESKIEEMRNRVKELKGIRLEEERKFVEKKLELAFQNQCEQMRSLLTKRVTKELVKDWDEQLKMKYRLEYEEQENERMYCELVLQDIENKWKREKAYDDIRKEATKKALEEMDRQVEYKKAKAADKAKIIARELAINDAIMKEIEDERLKRVEEKNARFVRAKEHTKDMLDTRNYYRDRKLKREEIVAQEFLRKAIKELYIEEADRNKAKRELMRSINIYLDYLKKRDCFANSKENEIMKIIDAVIEEQYEKVYAIRRKEQAQRQRLFCNVMAGRAQQIQDLKCQGEKDEMERQKELQFLKDDWKDYLREIEHEEELKRQRKQQYRSDLDSQVCYQGIMKGRECDEARREDEMCEMEEGFFLNRMNTTVKQAKLERSNPYRQCLVNKEIKQCMRPVPRDCCKQ